MIVPRIQQQNLYSPRHVGEGVRFSHRTTDESVSVNDYWPAKDVRECIYVERRKGLAGRFGDIYYCRPFLVDLLLGQSMFTKFSASHYVDRGFIE